MFFFFCFFFLTIFFLFLNLKHCISFAKHQNEAFIWYHIYLELHFALTALYIHWSCRNFYIIFIYIICIFKILEFQALRFPIYSLPLHMYSLPHYQHHSPRCYIYCKDVATSANHQVFSGSCTFYGFCQMCNECIQHYSIFTVLKVSCALLTHLSLS